MSCLGLVTVGQAPRNDIVPYLAKILGQGITLIEKGALDGMSTRELVEIAPTPGENRLATRLADGTQVVTSRDKTIPLIQACIDDLNTKGADLILILCTGHFPCFKSQVLVLESQQIVDHVLEAILDKKRTLGLFVPLTEQKDDLITNLTHITPRVVTVSASPYKEDSPIEDACRELLEHMPDLIVLHCMGYNEKHREKVARMTNVPIIVANSIVARTIAELLQGNG